MALKHKQSNSHKPRHRDNDYHSTVSHGLFTAFSTDVVHTAPNSRWDSAARTSQIGYFIVCEEQMQCCDKTDSTYIKLMYGGRLATWNDTTNLIYLLERTYRFFYQQPDAKLVRTNSLVTRLLVNILITTLKTKIHRADHTIICSQCSRSPPLKRDTKHIYVTNVCFKSNLFYLIKKITVYLILANFISN